MNENLTAVILQSASAISGVPQPELYDYRELRDILKDWQLARLLLDIQRVSGHEVSADEENGLVSVLDLIEFANRITERQAAFPTVIAALPDDRAAPESLPRMVDRIIKEEIGKQYGIDPATIMSGRRMDDYVDGDMDRGELANAITDRIAGELGIEIQIPYDSPRDTDTVEEFVNETVGIISAMTPGQLKFLGIGTGGAGGDARSAVERSVMRAISPKAAGRAL